METETENLVTVLIQESPPAIAVAKSILDDANIPYLAKGEGALQTLYAFGRVEIQVFERDAEEARRLLADL